MLRTQNEMTLAVSGTGSAGMEAAVVNLIEPGDSMVVCVNGVFGGRMADVAGRAGAEVTRIDRPWGEVFTPDDLKPALAKARPKVVGIVMAETSTGAWQPIEEIAQAGSRSRGAAAGRRGHVAGRRAGRSRRLGDRRHLFRHAKMPELPARPGAGFVQRSGAWTWCWVARRRCKAGISTCRCWPNTGARTGLSSHGPDQHDLRPVRSAADGAGRRARRLLRPALAQPSALKAGLAAIGIELCRPRRAPTADAQRGARFPTGVDDAAVRRGLLERFGIEIGGGLGDFKGKVWRIGLMGYGSRAANVLLFLAALEALLAEQGHRFDAGAGVAAANRCYAAK